MRLFRNHPLIRFEGVIHENIWPGIVRYRAAHGGTIGTSTLGLDHVGYEGDQTRKHHRNLPLLLRALERDPTHVYCWYHLGVVWRGLGELEKAREALGKAIHHARRKAKPYSGDCAPFIVLIDMQLQAGEDVAALLAEAQRLFPDNPLLVWQEGLLRIRERRHEDALACFEWLLARGAGEEPCFDHVGYDRRLFTLVPYGQLGTCHFQLGHYAEAGRWFARAEEADPEHLEYRVKRRLCAALAGVPAGSAAPCRSP
jgi:tetratricopeptide (TPR) repeat protein